MEPGGNSVRGYLAGSSKFEEKVLPAARECVEGMYPSNVPQQISGDRGSRLVPMITPYSFKFDGICLDICDNIGRHDHIGTFGDALFF